MAYRCLITATVSGNPNPGAPSLILSFRLILSLPPPLHWCAKVHPNTPVCAKKNIFVYGRPLQPGVALGTLPTLPRSRSNALTLFSPECGLGRIPYDLLRPITT